MKNTLTLKRRNHPLSSGFTQVNWLKNQAAHLPKFNQKLAACGIAELKPRAIEILQLNLGYMCDLTCSHCHVDAGPGRREIMTKNTMKEVLEILDEVKPHTVDLTGGAPELNPNFKWLLGELVKRDVHIIVRSNLTILVSNEKFRKFPQLFKNYGVEVIASLPCYTQDNVDKQRGNGVFNRSIEALKVLNELGYGVENTGLKLNLVYNPVGASLPGNQQQLEADYKKRLQEDWGIQFNQLYTITNLPISRFLDSLIEEGKYESYMELLVQSFNPAAVKNVMCTNTLSIGWQGLIFDCDFNQMLDLMVHSTSMHVSFFDLSALNNREIRVGQHCFGCTAGAGSSCQGALVKS